MFKTINQPTIEGLKKEVADIADALKSLTKDIGHQELIETTEDLALHINDPYLFVIVGEVKAGKSSFINALLSTGREICKVAPSPMTDTIQEITYGEEESEVIVNQYLKRIYQPVDILKEISIVDTPGTNTIVDHHQEITERFVPAADLIVFVFEAKNPYRESSWQFFDYINSEWWKKVIFVLQQKDLLEPSDLNINHKGVSDYAIKKGIENPKVFNVSAKQEINGELDESGFIELRSYIEENLLAGQAPVLKQLNNLDTISNIHGRLEGGVNIRKAQYDADISFRNDIRETLAEQELKTAKQVDVLVENLIAAYDNVTLPKLEELREGLGFFSMVSKSFKSTFGSNDSPKQWLNAVLEGLDKDLNYVLKDRLNEGVVDIADSIQQMGKMVDLKLRNSQTILKNDHEIFSDIAERRANVLRDLQQSFSDFLNSTDNFYDKELARTSDSIAPNLAAASGITAVGVILAAVTNGMVFDITGGVLTTAGLLFAGATLGFKRRKILREFTSELSNGKDRFRTEVSDSLKSYITRIKDRINDNFTKFDQHLTKEGSDIENYQSRLSELQNGIVSARTQINNI